MPTYAYGCDSCGHSFDAFQNMSDEPIKKCPECGNAVKRLINGGIGVVFKGSGFYVNDSKKKAPACDSKASSSCEGCSKAKESA